MIALIILSTFIICILYIIDKEISTRELCVFITIIVLINSLLYLTSIIPIHNDTNFVSGRLNSTVFHPYFVEKYQQPHTICTPCGKSTCCHTYYTTEYAKHKPYWVVKDTLGRDWNVSENFHNLVKNDFGNNKITTKPNKCTHGGHFYKGDPYLYTYNNETNTYNYPVNKIEHWYNPLKGKTSIFNTDSDFTLPYPKSFDVYTTTRNMTDFTDITRKQWDIFNTRLYEINKTNSILIKLENIEQANKLEKSWLNGKINDIVICFIGDYKSPEHVKVFGWFKSSYLKYTLETYILDNGIQNKTLDGIIEIIRKDYEPYDMKKFNYLTKPISIWYLILAAVLDTIVLILLGNIFRNNYETKDRHDPDFFEDFFGG